MKKVYGGVARSPHADHHSLHSCGVSQVPAGALEGTSSRAAARRVDHRIAELLAEREVPRTRFLIPASEKSIVLEAARPPPFLPRPPLRHRQRRPLPRDPSALPRRLRPGPGRRTPHQIEPQPSQGFRSALREDSRSVD
jgi:hypothetical protein